MKAILLSILIAAIFAVTANTPTKVLDLRKYPLLALTQLKHKVARRVKRPRLRRELLRDLATIERGIIYVKSGKEGNANLP